MIVSRIPLCLMVLLSWWAAVGASVASLPARHAAYGIGSGTAPVVPVWLDAGRSHAAANRTQNRERRDGDGPDDGLVSTPLIARAGAVGWRGVAIGPERVWSEGRRGARRSRAPPRG